MLTRVLKNRRLRILYYSTLRRRSDTSYKYLLWNCFRLPTHQLAQRYIHRVDAGAEDKLVYFTADARPLHFPGSVDFSFLEAVVAELSHKNWHCYEIPETTVNADDVVLDCGAAEGLFAYSVADRSKRVICFEPLPEFAATLKRTFAVTPNVTVVNKALSEHSGRAWLHGSGLGARINEQASANPVDVCSIDDYCAETGIVPTYIKADLEGHEVKMLKGAAKLIRAMKPRIAVTTYHYSGDAEATIKLLRELNPAYQFLLKGAEQHRGDPMMLHAW